MDFTGLFHKLFADITNKSASVSSGCNGRNFVALAGFFGNELLYRSEEVEAGDEYAREDKSSESGQQRSS